MPIRVGQLKPGMITSSWVTTQPPDGAYDVAYDIWFNRSPATSGAPDGGELMIWLAHRGGSQIAPAGAPVAHVAIDGYAFTLWLWTGQGGQHRISYVMDHPVQSVRDFDVSGVVADAARRGYLSATSYLLNIQAGFEIWQGGRGLGHRVLRAQRRTVTRRPAVRRPEHRRSRHQRLGVPTASSASDSPYSPPTAPPAAAAAISRPEQALSTAAARGDLAGGPVDGDVEGLRDRRRVAEGDQPHRHRGHRVALPEQAQRQVRPAGSARPCPAAR